MTSESGCTSHPSSCPQLTFSCLLFQHVPLSIGSSRIQPSMPSEMSAVTLNKQGSITVSQPEAASVPSQCVFNGFNYYDLLLFGLTASLQVPSLILAIWLSITGNSIRLKAITTALLYISAVSIVLLLHLLILSKTQLEHQKEQSVLFLHIYHTN